MKIRNKNIENRTSHLLNYLTDYIYTVYVENGEVVSTDHGPGCLNVTGYSPEDYNKNIELWHRMIFKEDREKVVKRAELAIKGVEVPTLEHRIIHKDGFLRWVKNTIVITKDDNGNVIYYDGLITDITDFKRAEKANEQKRKQLIQADKMASLGVLVSGIAHEINNPNNFILLNSQFLTSVWRQLLPFFQKYKKENEGALISGMSLDLVEEKIQQSIAGITKGSNRISKITKILTNYAKPDTGELKDKVDLNKVVKNAVLLTGNLIKNSTHSFTVNYKENLPLVEGNSQQLEQVVINLINNACQALKSMQDDIVVNFFIESSSESIVIEIADEGKGIEENLLTKIFDPFFTTKRDFGGTGLGLSISYNIIKNHGGDLIIKSQPNIGTQCFIKLPIIQN